MSIVAVAGLTLRARRRRLVLLLAFAAMFLLAALTARLLTGQEHGHVELDRIFEMGGYPLVSGLLLTGWLLGRFPIIATLALLAGVFSDERREGYARLFAVRPLSPVRLHLQRVGLLALLAFALCALLMPLFDLIMLGRWPDATVFVLIASYVIVYGGLMALLSVWMRGEVWVVTLLAIGSLIWDALRRADALPLAPGVRDFIGLLLPPQAALFQVETAFGNQLAVPWSAFAYAVVYGLALIVLSAVSVAHREI